MTTFTKYHNKKTEGIKSGDLGGHGTRHTRGTYKKSWR